MTHRHIEAALAVHRQGDPDQLRRHLIDACRFGIEGDQLGVVQLGDQRRQLCFIAHDDCLDDLLRLDDAGFRQLAMQPAVDLVQAFAQRPEFKRGKDIVHRLQLEVLPDARLEIKLDIEVAHNGRQFATQVSHVAALGQPIAHARADVGQMLIDGVEVAILAQQLGRRFFADAGDARDIVRAIAHHRLEIHQLAWLKPPFLAECRHIPDLVVIAPLRQLHPNMRTKQLQDIAVAGGDMHIQTHVDRLPADRAQHIIRLHIGHGQLRDVKRLDQLANAIELAAQVVWHFLARRLVLGINLLARAQAFVKCDREILGLIMLVNIQQRPAEAVDSARALAARCREAPMLQGEITAISERVTVDQIQYRTSFHKQKLCVELLSIP